MSFNTLNRTYVDDILPASFLRKSGDKEVKKYLQAAHSSEENKN